MKIRYSQPDIQTIIKRIDEHELNLQPNFQRGEVWSVAKKQRLIDSILRDWHVPPIHVIQLSNGNQEVLDGQQRLASIRDFVHGELKVDGNTEPSSSEIAALDGLTFSDLPKNIQKNFNRFTITVNTITDYQAEEPGELFYRLNQPIRLSSAEERNAFFGKPRQQVKDLVLSLSKNSLDTQFLGFSNSRMAYDDVLARLCYTLELGTLHEKVESPMLASKYRSNTPFAQMTIDKVNKAIQLLGKAKKHIGVIDKIRFNRASLFSWLLFLVNSEMSFSEKTFPKLIGNYIFFFETLRSQRKYSPIHDTFAIHKYTCPGHFVDQLMEIYIDRSTSRVTDVNSVLSRDIILWTFFGFHLTNTDNLNFSHPSFVLILKHIEVSTSGKEAVNPFNFLEKLIEEWEMPK
jgi:hypothetical protein